jgi:hypothetical protein
MNTNPDPTWPNWLADIYGPGQIGRERRAKALAEHADHKRQVEARLDANRGRGPGAETPRPRLSLLPISGSEHGRYTEEEMRRSRRDLGIREPGTVGPVQDEL